MRFTASIMYDCRKKLNIDGITHFVLRNFIDGKKGFLPHRVKETRHPYILFEYLLKTISSENFVLLYLIIYFCSINILSLKCSV